MTAIAPGDAKPGHFGWLGAFLALEHPGLEHALTRERTGLAASVQPGLIDDLDKALTISTTRGHDPHAARQRLVNPDSPAVALSRRP